MTAIKGIDVSKHNGKINWSKVKDSGIKFVIIRAGYGSNTIDERFEEYIRGAIKEKIDVGIYWFSYATNEEKAKLEAKKCMEVIKPYKEHIIYPVFYDFEYDSVRYAKKQGVSINKTKATNFAYAFLKEIKKGGYKPGLYTNLDFSKNYFFKSILRDYDVWIAQYGSRLYYKDPHVMWQYSESGRVNGIIGNVDMNYCYKKYNKNESSRNENTSENKKEDSSKETLIKELQKALNKSYNLNLDVDGSFGPKTKAAVKEHVLSTKQGNKKLDHTKWLQKALKDKGYSLDVDGYFGKDTKDKLEKYQRANNLQVDGMAGIATHTSIINHK